ncbi:MAG: hypothetical protein Q8M76_04410, partial [Spirochaetaceae bacterium]|nr:hypothetical protein [Spirochaetaceae bacterium]
MKSGRMKAGTLLAVAARNVARQKRRSLLLGGAVAFASLVMGLTSGMTGGMERSVQDNVALAAGGHLVVSGLSRGSSGRPQARIQNAVGLAGRVAAVLPSALSISPIASTQAALIFGTRQQSLRLSGIDWASDRLYRGSLVLV